MFSVSGLRFYEGPDFVSSVVRKLTLDGFYNTQVLMVKMLVNIETIVL